jgi:hypothetical protein
VKDSGNNVSVPSEAFVVIVDTTPPLQPTIIPLPMMWLILSNVAKNDATNDTTPTLSGTAEAGSTWCRSIMA